MLTDKDLNRIVALVATKEDIQRIEGRIDRFENTMQRVLSALDRLATAIEKLNIEYAAISEQLSRHDRWIRQIAKQAKVKLEDGFFG